MKFGLSLPSHGDYSDIDLLIELAVSAENAGWDGFFLWDHYARGVSAHVDPWIAMAAVAVNTESIRLGLLVTPLSRRRPWKVAREIVSLDHLSKGRMVMGVGLGDFNQKEFKGFGEVDDPTTRGEMLNEAIEIVTGLQSAEPFAYSGTHYRVAQTVFNPVPIQRPYVPVWVAGNWPNRPPFRRAARWDGVVPLAKGRPLKKYLTPVEVKEIVDYIERHRTIDRPFDFCLSGILPGKAPAADREIIESYIEVGVTWWIEFVYSGTGSVKNNRERISSGPPFP